MANIYTNLASHRSTYVPTEQKMPFQAYAAVGAHQQQRTDKLLKEASEMGLDIDPMKYDVDEASNLLKGFQEEQQNIVDNFDNFSDTDLINEVNKLRFKKAMAGKPGTPEYNIAQRNAKHTSNTKNATTAAKKDYNKTEWFNLNADLNSKESGNSQNEDGTFNEVPELNFQEHVDGAAFTKLGNDILLRKSKEILEPEEIRIVEDIIRSSSENGIDLEQTMSFIKKEGTVSGKEYAQLYSDLLNQLSTPQNKKSLSDEVDAEYYQYLKQRNNYLPEEEQLTPEELRDQVFSYQQGDIEDPNFQGGLTSQEYANEKLKSKVGSMADIATERTQAGGTMAPIPGQGSGSNKGSEEEEEELSRLFYNKEPVNLSPSGNFSVQAATASLKTKKDKLQILKDAAAKKRNSGEAYGMNNAQRDEYVQLKKEINTDELYLRSLEQDVYKNPKARELAMQTFMDQYAPVDEDNNPTIWAAITGGAKPWDIKEQGAWNTGSDGTHLNTEELWKKDKEKYLDYFMRRALHREDPVAREWFRYYAGLGSNALLGDETAFKVLGANLREIIDEEVTTTNNTYKPLVISDSEIDPKNKFSSPGIVSETNNRIANSISNNPAGYRVVGVQDGEASIDLGTFIQNLNDAYGVSFKVQTEIDDVGMSKGANLIIPREGEEAAAMVTLVPHQGQMSKDAWDDLLAQTPAYWRKEDMKYGEMASINGFSIKIPVTSLGKESSTTWNSNIKEMANGMYEQALGNEPGNNRDNLINDARFIKANLAVGDKFGDAIMLEQSHAWVPESEMINGKKVYNEESGKSEPVAIDYWRHPTKGDIPIYIRKHSDKPIFSEILEGPATSVAHETQFEILDNNKEVMTDNQGNPMAAGSIRDLEVKWYEYLGRLATKLNMKDEFVGNYVEMDPNYTGK